MEYKFQVSDVTYRIRMYNLMKFTKTLFHFNRIIVLKKLLVDMKELLRFLNLLKKISISLSKLQTGQFKQLP